MYIIITSFAMILPHVPFKTLQEVAKDGKIFNTILSKTFWSLLFGFCINWFLLYSSFFCKLIYDFTT